MLRRQSVFALAVSQLVWLAVALCIFVLALPVSSPAQVNTATLSGTIMDPQGLAVRGAKVTLTSKASGAERSIVADDTGRYVFVGITPGIYKMSVDGGGSFSPFEAPSISLTVGQDATFDA